MSFLRCGAFELSLARPRIMGIVNVTPDSFADGGRYAGTERALAHANSLVEQGADIVDVGGESTRPGAEAVDAQRELERVLPVLQGLRGIGVPVSIDTSKPEVMSAAIAAGASMVNDVNALQAEGALDAVASSGAALCLMHKQGDPKSMQHHPHYVDVVAEVRQFLGQRVAAAQRAGIALERIAIDPGFGFGKTLEHNLMLLRHLDRFADMGAALLVGLSRKAMFGKITGAAVGERAHASVAAALLAVQKGARIVRVHDVKATRDALAVLAAVAGPSL
jgi:dihydropteroate synthase